MIGAFGLSWVWWLVLLIATPPLIMLQCVWCCSMRKRGLIVAMVLCLLSALFMIFAGIYIILAWKDNKYCYVFILTLDDDDYYYSFSKTDYCTEIAWAVVAFIDACIFAGAAWCLYMFAFYRMDSLLAKRVQEQEEQVQVVEMRNVVALPAAAPTLTAATGVPANVIPEEVSSSSARDMDKIDNV